MLSLVACGGGSTATQPDGSPDSDVDGPPADGKLRGRWLDTYHFLGGTTDVAGNLANTPIRAWVHNEFGEGEAAWAEVAGHGQADGNFVVDLDAPGEVTLQIGIDFVVTSVRDLDYGADLPGRPNHPTANNFNTQVEMAWSGLEPWQASSELELISPETGAWSHLVQLTASPTPPIGATTIDAAMTWIGQGMIDGAAGHHLVGIELQPQSLGGVGTLVATRAVRSADTFRIVEGSTAKFTGAMAAIPAVGQARLDWRRSQFDVLKPHPSANIAGSELAVVGAPASLTAGVFAPIGHLVLVPLGPQPSSDADLGTVPYGNPFGPADGVHTYALRSFLTPLALPGTVGSTASVGVVSVARAADDASPLVPLVGPVGNLAINGLDATAPQTGVGRVPVLTWNAPAVGSADHYVVTVFKASVENMRTVIDPVAAFVTSDTKLRIPPRVLQTGATYHFEVRAVHEAVDTARKPFRHVMPQGAADAHTALISV